MTYPHTFRTEHTETKTTSSVYGSFYERQKLVHVSIAKELVPLLHYVDDHNEMFIQNLKSFVEIQNVGGVFEKRLEMEKMINTVEKWLRKLKIKYERFDVGWYTMSEACCKMPNVILGETISKSSRPKKTVRLFFTTHINLFRLTESLFCNLFDYPV